jgi:anti-sigma B factor antagonist
MKITKEVKAQGLLIYLEGEMDASTSILVDLEINQFYQLELENLWIDCQKLHYISSAGVGVFISHLQKLQDHRKNFVLVGPKPKIRAVFSVLGLDNLLNSVPVLENISKNADFS